MVKEPDRRALSKLSLDEDEFDHGETKQYHRVAPIHVSEVVRPNRLFLKAAAVLGRDADVTYALLAPLMARAEFVPQGLTREQLTALSPGLLEIIETTLPFDERDPARDRLCKLLGEEPTLG
jgi:hypothetical protein